MANPGKTGSRYKDTPQEMDSDSFDDKYGVAAREMLVENEAENALIRLKGSTFGLRAGTDFDYIEVTATSGTVDTLDFKSGGTGGTTVRSLVITYSASDVAKVSDTFDKLEFS